MFKGAIAYCKDHAIQIAILVFIVILIIVVASKREGYIGDPLGSLKNWTSGSQQRRGGQIFTMTNQGENMSGHRSIPYYMQPSGSGYSRNYSSKDYGTKNMGPQPPMTMAPSSGPAGTILKEGYKSNIEENYLHRNVY